MFQKINVKGVQDFSFASISAFTFCVINYTVNIVTGAAGIKKK